MHLKLLCFRSIFLNEQALKAAEMVLKPGGNFICKVFVGEDLENFINMIKNKFKKIYQFTPKASRKSSSETYVIAKFLQNR